MDYAQMLKDSTLAHAESVKAGIAAGRRDSDALRKAAAHTVAMWEKYPEAILPHPIMAALFALKVAL